MGDQCAPSRQLQNGTEVEIAFLAQAMFKGWAVAVTDYEGLGTPGDHTYAVARSEGRALLDVARAAGSIPGLSAAAPIGVFGYSQGGQAASAAAEQWQSYAPSLNVVGVAAGGVPADLNAVAKFNDGNAGSEDLTVVDRTWTWLGTRVMGAEWHRCTSVVSDDGNTMRASHDRSPDGSSWTPWMDVTLRRVI